MPQDTDDPRILCVPFLCASLLLGLTVPAAAQVGTSNELFADGFPRAFWFRTQATESTIGLDANNPMEYGPWEARINLLDGLCGNRPGWMHNSQAFFTKYAPRNPGKFVFAMVNGRSRNAEVSTTQTLYSAEDWLYFAGSNTVTALTGHPLVVLSVDVVDTSGFRNGDDVVIVNGPPGARDWANAEQAQVVGINGSTLSLQRGLYGTALGSFPAGAYIAAHVFDPDKISDPTRPQLWCYNYAAASCRAARLQDTQQTFRLDDPSAPESIYQGIQIDVLNRDPKAFSEQRALDVDNDGVGDDDHEALDRGIAEFLEGVRAAYSQPIGPLDPSVMLTFDNQNQRNGRSVGIVSGVESERFPSGQDGQRFLRDWSSGVNRLLFWNEHADTPTHNYINHKFNAIDEDGDGQADDVPYHAHRSSLAMGPMMDWSVTFFKGPDVGAPFGLGVFDEMVRGVDQVPNWLGQPTEPPQRLAKNTPDRLGGEGAALTNAFLAKLQVSGGTIQRLYDQNGPLLRVLPTSSTQDVVITYPDLAALPGDLVVFATVWAEAIPEPHQRFRVLEMTCHNRYIGPDEPTNARRYSPDQARAWAHTTPYEAEFYWRRAGGPLGGVGLPRLVDLKLRLRKGQTDAAFFLRDLTVHSATPAMQREFENGLVMVNPSTFDHTFTVGSGGSFEFERIVGTAGQDPAFNDGRVEGGSLTLGPRDAIFLRRR